MINLEFFKLVSIGISELIYKTDTGDAKGREEACKDLIQLMNNAAMSLNLKDLTEKDLMILGFVPNIKNKSVPEGKALYLIPLWAIKMIPEGTELMKIDGSRTKAKPETKFNIIQELYCLDVGVLVDKEVINEQNQQLPQMR